MTKKSRLALEADSLLNASDYQTFLKIYFQAKDQITGKKISYAEFSRRAQLQSRSFPRDVVTGKRRMTARTVSMFNRAMGLSTDWKEYFRLLVALKEPDTLAEGWPKEKIQDQLTRLRMKLEKGAKVRYEASPTIATRLSAMPESLRVYASIGGISEGVTTEHVIKRTGLTSQRVEAVLKMMEELKIITKNKQQKWVAEASHFSITGIKRSDVFQKLFEGALYEASKKSRNHMDSEEDLFFCSAFSVNKKRMPELKKLLRNVLLNFVDESETSDGDSIVSLTCGFHL